MNTIVKDEIRGVRDEISGSYDLIIAGFKYTANIKPGDLKIQDLLYCGGIRPFLESLS